MEHYTIIIPAFNEGKVIGDVLEKLGSPEGCEEIIVINDGSTDDTAEAANRENIRVISHIHNKGYGSALKTGIINAKTPLVAFYDADGQHRPDDLMELVRNLGKYDMIVGERGADSHQDWVRKPGKWVLSKIANYLTEQKIPDLNSGLRILKREIILNILHLMPDNFSFSTTSTVAFLKLGFDIKYYPIKVNKRTGKSTVRQLKHGSSTILLIIRLILLFNPLKVFLPMSLFLFSIGSIYELLYGIILRPGMIRLIPGAMFTLLTAVIIFAMGMTLDQISSLRKNIHFDKLIKSLENDKQKNDREESN